MKITLLVGKAHLKHTEGGDFRQATYRAVRQGLMQAKSVLLEPWYAFTLTMPTEQIGRAITDIRAMGGEFDAPESNGAESTLCGTVPAAEMRHLAARIHLTVEINTAGCKAATDLRNRDNCNTAGKLNGGTDNRIGIQYFFNVFQRGINDLFQRNFVHTVHPFFQTT